MKDREKKAIYGIKQLNANIVCLCIFYLFLLFLSFHFLYCIHKLHKIFIRTPFKIAAISTTGCGSTLFLVHLQAVWRKVYLCHFFVFSCSTAHLQ